MENNNESMEKTAAQAPSPKGSADGLFALAFSVLSMFILPVVFVPSALFISVLALLKKQYIWAGIAIVISLVSAFTWLMLGVPRLA